MNVPDDLRFAESHEWLRMDGENASIGISDHAQEELTDIVYVELPQVGDALQAGHPAAVVESVKAASDIYSPISGTVTEINEALGSNPALVNTDPYGEGWLFRVKIEAGEEIERLKTAAQYKEQIGGNGSASI